MLNEIEEFKAYTDKPVYKCSGKRDLSFLGRFSFEMMKDFTGLSRVLTIIARGYMFRNGAPDVDYARRALCAWCSIPDKKTAAPKEEWQFKTDFSDLHEEFPELVDKTGKGWFYRHVHKVERFITKNSENMSKTTLSNAEPLKNRFDAAWRDKVKQYQVSLYSPETKGAWVALLPDGLPYEVAETVIAYCIANKPDDSDYVILPVSNFDAYFGSTSFSHKWLNLFPDTLLEREKQSFGVCRVKTIL